MRWRGAHRPESLLYSIERLEGRLRAEPGQRPAAFIFHGGRCGSTLLARLFAAAGGARVFDEPGAFHDFRDARWRQLASADSRRALHALIAAHGLGPVPGEARLVMKFDSRAVLAVPALRACFPTVPFIYLLRSPREIVASVGAAPPGFLAPDARAAMAAMFGGVEGALENYSEEAWYAWYAERNLRAALDHARCFTEVIDYGVFATRYLATVNRLSGTALRADDPRVEAVLSRHAKYPVRPFPAGSPPPDAATALQATKPLLAAEAAYAAWQAHMTSGSN
ncbi:MAG: hypothetical protein RLZZ15_3199 [Verrucomicrobiota bacterium]